MSKPKNSELSVFKGREAKLNYAIFTILSLKGPLTIYDIHKQVRATRGLRYTRYASVNKRVKALEETGYITRIGSKKSKAGFVAFIYELTTRASLACFLKAISIEELIKKMDDAAASSMLALLIELVCSSNGG